MIPVNEPRLAKNTLKYVAGCVETGWISSAGSFIRRFEEEFARYFGVGYAVTTTSGTTALHLALAALGLGPGDEVVVPDHTMIAVPYAVLYTGAKPVLLDVDRETFNLDPALLRNFLRKECLLDRRRKIVTDKRTGRRVRAVLPVHLFGHPCPMDEILAIAREYGLLVVEDAAEAHGALYYPRGDKSRAKFAGTMGDAGCFSFYANKILTTGEGGMVVTDDPALAERARRLKDLAHDPGRRFLHTELAFNYRMTNVQAAIGLAQLEEIDRFILRKQRMAAAYDKGLAGVRGLTLPVGKIFGQERLLDVRRPRRGRFRDEPGRADEAPERARHRHADVFHSGSPPAGLCRRSGLRGRPLSRFRRAWPARPLPSLRPGPDRRPDQRGLRRGQVDSKIRLLTPPGQTSTTPEDSLRYLRNQQNFYMNYEPPNQNDLNGISPGGECLPEAA